MYVANKSPSALPPSKNIKAGTTAQGSQADSARVEIPKSAWATTTSKDEMTNKVSAFAFSPTVYPSRKMSFPYNDVSAWLGVGCDGSNEWVYIGFNSAPNLKNDETQSGYNLIRTRIKWGVKVENVTLSQEWGAKFIQFRNDSSAIAKISSNSNALLELQWHGEQSVYFDFSLDGSKEAISDMRAKCKK